MERKESQHLTRWVAGFFGLLAAALTLAMCRAGWLLWERGLNSTGLILSLVAWALACLFFLVALLCAAVAVGLND